MTKSSPKTNNSKANSKKAPRRKCCQSLCPDCPYDFGKDFDPNTPLEFQLQNCEKASEYADLEKYLQDDID